MAGKYIPPDSAPLALVLCTILYLCTSPTNATNSSVWCTVECSLPSVRVSSLCLISTPFTFKKPFLPSPPRGAMNAQEEKSQYCCNTYYYSYKVVSRCLTSELPCIKTVISDFLCLAIYMVTFRKKSLILRLLVLSSTICLLKVIFSI